MSVNADKVHLWKADVAQSVDFYNGWFMRFAPKTYRNTRISTTRQVKAALELTANLTNISPQVLKGTPAIGQIIRHLTDQDIFTWLASKQKPSPVEVDRAATIVADRLCGALADPIIRNAQEKRQLKALKHWLEVRGYKQLHAYKGKFNEMQPGSFVFRLNIPVTQNRSAHSINIPIDAVIMPLRSKQDELPLLIETKSAGDYTNTNKRRKEEAIKVAQLTSTYGSAIRFVLFLCGYFDSGYLGYEAAEGIDWVWEHWIDDLAKFGL